MYRLEVCTEEFNKHASLIQPVPLNFSTFFCHWISKLEIYKRILYIKIAAHIAQMMAYCLCKMRICERYNNSKHIMISIDICVVFGRTSIVSTLESSTLTSTMRSRLAGSERSLRPPGSGNFPRKRNTSLWLVSSDHKG